MMNTERKAVIGFTVIELAMVLIIVGIMAIIVGPKFFSTISYQQQVYYDEIVNSIRYARKLAVATGGHIQVNLTSTSIILQNRIEGSSCTSGTTFQAITDPTNKTSGYIKNAPGAVTMSYSANWPIYFNGLGQALTASNCTVINNAQVTITGGNSITVIGETGYVQ